MYQRKDFAVEFADPLSPVLEPGVLIVHELSDSRPGTIFLGSKHYRVNDTLFIEGLAVDCVIGFAEWERLVKQTVLLDLEIDVDVHRLALADEVGPEDLNTRSLSKRLQQFVGDSEFRLIETLAERTAELVLADFPVSRIVLKLSKPGALRGAANVGVRIVRPRR